MEDIKCLYEQVSSILEAKGFHEYELYASQNEEFSVVVSNGQIERYNVNNGLGVNLRVKSGNRIGYASTTVLDADSCRALCQGAIANLDLINLAEEQFIFDGKNAVYEPLDSYSDELDEITAAEKCEIARKLERYTLEKDPRVVRVHTCCCLSGSVRVTICNSHGLELTRRNNYIGAYIIPVVADKDVMNTSIGYCISRKKLTDEQLRKAADSAVTKAIELCGAAPAPSKTCPVIFRPDAFVDLLSTFADVFSAENGQKKLSLLTRDKLGTVVAAPCFTLIDDPLDTTGVNSMAFDDEGVPCHRKELIRDGVLTTLLYNLKSAAVDGVDSTGNGVKRSYTSPVDTAPINLIVAPGQTDGDGLMKEAGSGLIVEELAGMHSGANPETGDFSLSAKGYLFENGAISRSVGNITISGNFYTLLKDIQAVGNDTVVSIDGIVSPSVLVRALALGGE